jgi:hypothetical protein
MPDYLGEDQRKTKQKDEKVEDKPIKGNIFRYFFVKSNDFPLFST